MSEGSINLIKVFGAFSTVDEFNKRGVCLGWYSTQEAAALKARKEGWFGGDGVTSEAYALEICGKVYLLQDPEPIQVNTDHEERKKLIASAREKLTAEEIKAIGL